MPFYVSTLLTRGSLPVCARLRRPASSTVPRSVNICCVWNCWDGLNAVPVKLARSGYFRHPIPADPYNHPIPKADKCPDKCPVFSRTDVLRWHRAVILTMKSRKAVQPDRYDRRDTSQQESPNGLRGDETPSVVRLWCPVLRLLSYLNFCPTYCFLSPLRSRYAI